MNKFYYIAPQLFPVVAEKAGKTIIGIDFQALLNDAAYYLPDADITATVELFMAGKKVEEEELTLRVRNEEVQPKFLNRKLSLSEHGYAVISLQSAVPYFRKLKPELGYAMLARPDGGSATIISQGKYAELLIIDNMRETGTFCLVHPAHYQDKERNIGNSVFLINPYNGVIIARLINSVGKEFKTRLESCSATVVSLDPLLEDGQAECIMYTGNNRFIGWDLRHSLQDPDDIYSIDHLEYYRANPTMISAPFSRSLKNTAKRALRASGLWL